MKVLFATTNPAKVKRYKEQLSENGIELISINDIDEKLDINENGKDAIENAYIKAKTYYDKTKIPTIGIYDCLFIEGISEEEQPGTNVRRVNGKRLNDGEMIEHYISVIPESGKYFAELVEKKDEKYKKKNSIEKVVNFIIESLKS